MSRYIDADALRKAFYKDRVSVCSHVFSLVNPLDSEDLEFEIYNMIDAAPTVDAVPVRHGEWKPHPIKGCEEWDVCSACGIGTHRRLVSDLGEEEYSYSYCPWCGAKMDGEQ